MNKRWLVRYSEVFLKSAPVRRQWENVLVAKIREVMPGTRAGNERGRIWLDGDVRPELLKNIFGIVSFSEVEHVRLDEIDAQLTGYCASKGMGQARTFALRIKRVGSHPFSSREVAEHCGNLVRAAFPHTRVDLDAPDLEIFMEIRGGDCYLYTTVERGPGGIPPGVEGTLVALVSGGIDSPVAAWMMMKRGVYIAPLYVDIADVLDDTNLVRAGKAVEALMPYQPDIHLRVVTDTYLSAVCERLAGTRNERYACVLCKRRMYRIAGAYAREIGALGIVTGESVGQVASQTLDNLLVLDDAAELPVYRPLVGLDKEEIIRTARQIGTYIPSTEKASGCRAVPRKPSTRASLEKIRDIERQIGSFPLKETRPRGLGPTNDR